jgi:hypothetical protein
MTFDVPKITGEAVSEFVGSTSVAGVLMAIISLAILIGMFSYVAINRGVPGGIEQYYSKSKYWVGYAVQKVKWSAKKRKMKTGIEVDVPEETKSQQLFPSISKEIANLNIRVTELEQEKAEMKIKLEKAKAEKATQPVKSAPAAAPQPTVAAPKQQVMPKPAVVAPKPTAEKKPTLPVKPITAKQTTTPQPAITRPAAQKIPARPMPKPVQRPVQQIQKPAAVKKPVKQEVIPKPKEDTLTSRFGTNDPLKIAEAILRRKKPEK